MREGGKAWKIGRGDARGRERERESEIVEEGGKERSEMHSNVFERGE